MPANYGLIGDMAGGIREALIQYQSLKNQNQQKQLGMLAAGVQDDGNGGFQYTPQKQQQIKQQKQLGFLQAGVQPNDSGDLQYTPEKQEQIHAGLIASQASERENDPDSPLAQSSAQLYSQGGFKVPEGLSYNEQKGIVEPLAVAKQKADTAAATKQAVKPADWQKFGDDIDPTKARQGTLAKSQEVLNATQRLDPIFQQYPNGNMPAAQMAEAANAAAALYGGGTAQSQHQIDALVPKTMQGDAAKIASYFSNSPKGMDQGAFVDVMKQASAREAALAKEQIREGVGAKLSKYPQLYQADSDRFARMVGVRGIQPDELGNYGEFVPQQRQAPTANAPNGLLIPNNSPSKSDSEALLKKYGI